MEHKGEPQGFQFVTVTRPGHGCKNNNEHIVRSHVMKQVRRKQKLKVVEEAAKIGQRRKRRDGRLLTQQFSPEVCQCHLLSQNAVSTSAQQLDPLWTEGDEDSTYFNSVCGACAKRRLDRDRWNLKLLNSSNGKLSVKDQKLLKHICNFFSPIVVNIGHKFLLWTKGIKM